jgi:hypothetical protein
VLVPAAFALAVLGWFLAGWIVQTAGLDELGLPARVGGIFLALSLGEAALHRLNF